MLQALEKWKSVTFSDETQIVFDHNKNIYSGENPMKFDSLKALARQ